MMRIPQNWAGRAGGIGGSGGRLEDRGGVAVVLQEQDGRGLTHGASAPSWPAAAPAGPAAWPCPAQRDLPSPCSAS